MGYPSYVDVRMPNRRMGFAARLGKNLLSATVAMMYDSAHVSRPDKTGVCRSQASLLPPRIEEYLAQSRSETHRPVGRIVR